MTREYFDVEIKKCPFSNDKLDICEEYIASLEQRNEELQVTIKAMEGEYDTLYFNFVEQSNAFEKPKTCGSCTFCGEDCAVLEMLMSQFGFEVENCTCGNYKLKQPK